MNKSWNASEINKQRIHEPIKHCARCRQNPTVEQHGESNPAWTVRCDQCGQWAISASDIDSAIRAWNLQQRTQA